MSDLMQLPEMPTFSEHFYNDYEEALKDIEKIECLICLTEVPDRERAIECSCKKVFHLEVNGIPAVTSSNLLIFSV